MTYFWLTHPKVYDFIQFVATGGFWKPVVTALPDLSDQKVLDLGCGTGGFLDHVKPRGYIGIDNNSKFVNLAKRKHPGYTFLVKDVTKDALPSEGFDSIIIVNVLHHLTDKEIENLFAKIKKWGKAKRIIVVESKPKGAIGNILKSFDAGANFRSFIKLKKLVARTFKTEKEKVVSAPWGTYDYLILRSKI